ncbi:MAG TPA: PRTRC system protein C [Bryobacteraceae bacterium]|nr:PRTRC system protein C [Bryobacteraceae bacterium]
MPLKASRIEREFVYNGVKLPDPSPDMTIEQVRDIHAATYAEISTASIEGPETVGGKMRYTYSRSVGTKG